MVKTIRFAGRFADRHNPTNRRIQPYLCKLPVFVDPVFFCGRRIHRTTPVFRYRHNQLCLTPVGNTRQRDQMTFDLLIQDLREPLYETAVTAARLGRRIAVVDRGELQAEDTVSLAHVRQSLIELRRVEPEIGNAFDRLPGEVVDRLWSEAVNRAVTERQFHKRELRRHGVTFLDEENEPVRAEFSLQVQRPQQLALPAEVETINLPTLLQLPALPERIQIGVGGSRGLECASLLASIGVRVDLPMSSLRCLKQFDEEVIDRLLDRQSPGRIEVSPNDDSQSELVLVECQAESGHALADAETECVGIEETSDAGVRSIDQKLDLLPDANVTQTRTLQTLPAVASVGATESLHDKHLESGTTSIPDSDIPDGGLLKLVFHRQTRRLVGVHCVGENAKELVDIGAAVIECGGTIDDVRGSLFSVAEAGMPFRDAALDGLRKLQRRTLPALNVSLFRPHDTAGKATPRRKNRDAAPRVKRVKRPTASRRSGDDNSQLRLHRATN